MRATCGLRDVLVGAIAFLAGCSSGAGVTFMRFAQSLEEALRTAMEDLRHLPDPYAER